MNPLISYWLEKQAEMVKIAPFKSKAQRRKFYAMKAEGKMEQKTIDEWEEETPENIPEKVAKPLYEKGIRSAHRYVVGPTMMVEGLQEDFEREQNALRTNSKKIKPEKKQTKDQ